MHDHPIIVNGSGNSARAAALSLAAAGFEVRLAQAAPVALPDWQSVLALSPAAKRMLETLGVWARLDCPEAPVCDMQVYGTVSAVGDALLPARLGFGPDADAADINKEEGGRTVAPLAHIVSLASLGRALQAACDAHEKIAGLPAPIDGFEAATKTVTLENGDTLSAALLVDTHRAAPAWRQAAAARPLTRDYGAAALVAPLTAGRPHGQMAQQIFLPDGPLALLPRPQPTALALVWSLPAKRAAALAGDAAALEAALADATENRFGALAPDGPAAVQPLALHLAETYFDGPCVLLGEAAHVIHPLAGQGFNLTLRDAAVLADVLHDGRSLGLPADNAALLTHYQRARRSDAAVMAATTDALAGLFGGPLKHVGRAGLALAGVLAARQPRLRKSFAAQADGGTALPRLMRGTGF